MHNDFKHVNDVDRILRDKNREIDIFVEKKVYIYIAILVVINSTKKSSKFLAERISESLIIMDYMEFFRKQREFFLIFIYSLD